MPRDEVDGMILLRVGDKPVCRKLKGHGLLKELENMKQDIVVLAANEKIRAEQMAQLQREITSLEQQVKYLEQSSDGFSRHIGCAGKRLSQ